MQAAVAVESVPRNRAKPNHPPVPSEDVYGPVHKGLRWLLSQVMVAMGRTDFADEPGAYRIVTALDHVLDVCSAHLAHENAHVHTALDQRRPGASARLGGDHQHHERAIRELRAYAADVKRAAPESRVAFGRRLYLAYSAFVGENLIHMVEEEELAQAVLEEIYSTGELQELHRVLVTSVSPDEMLSFVKILLAGVDPAQRVGMVAAMSKALPIDEMATIVAGLRAEIGDHEWQAVATAFLRGV